LVEVDFAVSAATTGAYYGYTAVCIVCSGGGSHILDRKRHGIVCSRRTSMRCPVPEVGPIYCGFAFISREDSSETFWAHIKYALALGEVVVYDVIMFITNFSAYGVRKIRWLAVS